MAARPATMRVAVILAFAAWVGVASAHDAPAGWQYDPECCGGDTTGATQRGDCAQVDDEHIEEVQGGFRVTLPPGSHPMVRTRPLTVLVPHGDPRIRKSGDWRKHACVSASGTVYCIYVPAGST